MNAPTGRSWTILGIAVFTVMGVANPAEAGGIARHERVQVARKSIKGKPGFRLKVTMRPTDLTSAELGIGVTSVRTKKTNAVEIRHLVTKDDPAFIRLLFPKVKMAANKPLELVHDVVYGEGNTLKPGDKVDIFTRWDNPHSGDKFHVFGVFNGGEHSNTTVDLP